MEVRFKKVSADYQIGPIRSSLVLRSVDLSLKSGSFTAVIGHTGAGKSSLLKVMNGLLIPTQGEVRVGKAIIEAGNPKQSLKQVRKKVGMVFQFPESQLFAETVEKDICFGPLNFGTPLEKAKQITRDVIDQVGLDESILSKSPFSLSGGQKRRVAIAGILAMEPEVLVLDEPGAGLDPSGKKEIMSLISAWNQERGLTTVLVTHDMDDVAQYAEDVVVMSQGRIVLHDTVRNIFSTEVMDRWNLDYPNARRLQMKIEHQTGKPLSKNCLTVDELTEALIEAGLV